ncbi:hypothetical protein, partial [Streptococcus pneumoniae]
MVGAAAPLAHDPLDRLYRGVLDYGGPDTALLYDGTDLIAEVNQSNGTLLRRYANGDEVLI